MRLSSILLSRKIPHLVVSTPRSIQTSCSLSIKFSAQNLDKVKNVILQGHFVTFVGVFVAQ
jgi:hypothetical protein